VLKGVSLWEKKGKGKIWGAGFLKGSELKEMVWAK
jgi:hypothetical protein